VVYAPFPAGATPTADDINTKIVSETMAWTALSSVGVYASGFSAGVPAPRMRKLMICGAEVWELEGRIAITSLTAGVGGLATAFTFNVGFRTGSERGYMQYCTSGNLYPMFTAIKANGQLQIGIATAGGSSTTSVSLDGIRITNPLV
jgi:hypothetical protein